MSSLRTETVVIDYVLKSSDINKAKADFDKLTDAEKKAVDETKKLNDQLKTTGKEGSTSINKASQELNNFSGIAKSGAAILASMFALSGLNAFREKLVETTIKFEGYYKAIEFGSGNAKDFAKNQEFLNNLVQKYGLGLAQTTEAYKSFFTASTLAGQSQKETNRQFEAVTKAGTVLKLTTDQMQGAFLALGQMMSKGTVQAEELRGQLGERIPGAFNIMAKALNVNEQQLNKMLEQGKVLSKDALPAFAAELEKTFGPAAEKNLNGMVNSQNRFNSAIDNLILAVGNKLEPFLKGAYDLAAGIATQLAGIGGKAKQQTAENLGLKRAEADIVKQLIKYGGDVTVQNQKFIRQQEAVLLLLGMEEKIDKQLMIVAENRIKAAGDFNGVASKNLAASQKELDILIAEEKELARIAGIEVKRGEEKKVLTEADIKALKQQYDLELARLQILTQIRKIEMDSTAGNLGADKALYDAKLQLIQNYTKRGLTFAKEEKDLLIAQSKKAGEDLIQQDKKDHIESKNELDDYLKSSAKSYDEYLKAIQKKKLELAKTDKKGNQEFVQDETDKWRKIVAITQAYSQLANQVVQGFADLQYSRIQNEITLMNRKYDEETRLAGDNQQKLAQIAEKRAQKEKELRTQQFEAQRQAAIAEVIFRTAPIIAQQIAGVITAPLAIASYAAAATQIGFILAQPVPEFAEGTKGTPFKGTAIVGEKGPEKVVTESGKVYFTPSVATLAQFDEAVQIIPNNQLGLHDRQHLSLIYGNSTKKDNSGMQIVSELAEIKKGLAKMPVAAISIDAKGFQKSIRTQSRTTTILNNRMKN